MRRFKAGLDKLRRPRVTRKSSHKLQGQLFLEERFQLIRMKREIQMKLADTKMHILSATQAVNEASKSLPLILFSKAVGALAQSYNIPYSPFHFQELRGTTLPNGKTFYQTLAEQVVNLPNFENRFIFRLYHANYAVNVPTTSEMLATLSRIEYQLVYMSDQMKKISQFPISENDQLLKTMRPFLTEASGIHKILMGSLAILDEDFYRLCLNVKVLQGSMTVGMFFKQALLASDDFLTEVNKLIMERL